MTDSNRIGVPTESDWENYENDLDQKWAHDHYIGRTNEQMQSHFRNNPIESTDELRFMPQKAFRYYMLGFRDYIATGDFADSFASDAASCFIGLVLEKLEGQPDHIVPIIPLLLPTIEYVGENQAVFDAEEHIYGNFLNKLSRIRELYAETKKS